MRAVLLALLVACADGTDPVTYDCHGVGFCGGNPVADEAWVQLADDVSEVEATARWWTDMCTAVHRGDCHGVLVCAVTCDVAVAP